MDKFVEKIVKFKYWIIILLAAAVYVQTLWFDYVYIDDNEIILDRWEMIGSMESIPEAFTHDAFFLKEMTLYRPALTISLIVNAQIGGKEPWSYHLGNIILHSLASALVCLIFIRLGFRHWTGAVFGLLFAVHPAFVNPVCWIVARDGMLAAIFVFLSMNSFSKFINKNCVQCYFFHMLFFAAAVFSKEVALVFPGALIAYTLLIRKKKLFEPVHFLLLAGWVLVIILFFWLRSFSMQEGLQSEIEFGPGALLKNIAFIPEALFKLTLPIRHSVLPSYNSFDTVGGSIILAIVLFLLARKKMLTSPMVIFGAIWFLLFAVPGMFLRYPKADVYFDYVDNRLYLMGVGWFLIIAQLLKEKLFAAKNQISALLVIVVFSVLTILHSRHYTGPEAFWDNAVGHNPEKAMMHYRSGYSYWKYLFNELERGVDVSPERFDKITDRFDRSIELWDSHEDKRYVLKNYFNLLVQLRKFESAIGIKQEIDAYLRRYPRYSGYLKPSVLDAAKNLVDLGVVFYERKQYDKALEMTRMGLKLDESNFLALTNLGIIHKAEGDEGKAIKAWKQAVRINPADIDPMRHLLVLYMERKDYGKAKLYAKKIMDNGGEIDPGLIEFLNNN